MRLHIKIVLIIIVTLSILIYLVGFIPIFAQDGVITGRIEDIKNSIPVAKAIVSLTDTVGDIHSVSTDEKGYYFFNNLAVNANCVITANAVVNGKTMVFKDIIPHPVAANETYDAGTADAKSTALALIVEGLMDQGLTSGNINLETIQGSDNFVTVFNQVSIVLEDNSNVMDEIIVTGEGVSSDDGSTAYNVTVIRAPSSNADLSSLSVSEGTLNLVFDYADTSYTVAVANYISSITFTPTAADSLATITVDEAEVLSGGTSASIILGVGANTIDIVVTAEDETTKTYTVTVIRALSSNADLSSLSIDEGTPDLDFSSNTTTYEVAVVNSVDNITFTPTAADDTATINIDGTPVPSGVPSVPVNLDIRDNSIFIEVTAEDKTTNTYTITVNRNILKDIADLCDLTLSVGTLDPIFDSNTISYKVAVGHSVESITFTPVTIDAAASVKVDGTTVENGELPAPVSLDIGDNIIPTVVTAEDGVSTKTYMVNVNRLTTPTLTVAVDGSGSGTVRPAAGKHTYNYGDKVNLNSKAGKDSDFICWLQNENIDNITKANTRVTMNGDQTVTAIFNLTSDTHTPTMETGGTDTSTLTSDTHTLTMATDGNGTGTITVSPVKAIYNYGDKVNIKAKASADSVFTNWLTNENIDDTAKANTRVTMNGDQTVTAIFNLTSDTHTPTMETGGTGTGTFTSTTHTLIMATDGTGTGTVTTNPDKATYNHGDKVNIKAKASADSVFTNWLTNENIDDTAKANTRVTMNDDQTVTAIFTLMVTAGKLHHIVISPADPAAIKTGETQTYTAEAFDADNISLGDVTSDTKFTIEKGAKGKWDKKNKNVYTSEKAGTWEVTGEYSKKIKDTATLTVMVTAGKLHHIVISPADPAAIKTGETQTYTAEAFDADNISLGDVTSDTEFKIEKDAKGKWDKKNKNVYTSEKAGTWEVTGEYSKKIKDTATLTVAEVLPVIGGTVIITGDAKNGVTLEISGIIYTPSTEDDEPTYQWKRGGGAISGATSNTYTLVEADIGKKITVIVTADGIHATGNVTSAETAAVEKADGVVPAAPLELEGTKTATSITLTANVLHQFSKDDGVTWQDSNLFEELNPGTEYTFKAKAIETATHKESAASTGTAITTLVLTYYTLTIVADPVAGGTATDVPAAGPYAAGTVVNISAVANGGYEFDGWTAAPAVTFGDASTAVTTFTMSAQNVNVTANLVCKPLDKIDKINIDTDKPFLGTCATINSVTIKYEDGSNDEITPSYIGKGLSWSYDSTKISFDPATGKVCRTDGVVGTEYKITFTYTDACVESKTKEVKVKFEATLDKIEINIDTKEPCSDSCANINSVTIKYKDGSNNDEIIPSYSDTGLSWSYDSNNKIRFDPATGKVCLTDGVVGTEYKITFTYTTSTDDCVESVTKEVKVKFETCNP